MAFIDFFKKNKKNKVTGESSSTNSDLGLSDVVTDVTHIMQENRLLKKVLLASISLSIALLMCLLALLPLKEKQPMFLQFEPKENQVVRLEEMHSTKSRIEQIKKYFVREYVTKSQSFTYNLAEQKLNAIEVAYISKDDARTQYSASMDINNKYSIWHAVKTKKLVLKVDIISVEKLANNVYRVDYNLHTYDKYSRITGSETFRDTVTIEEGETESKEKYAYKNPFGLMVIDYHVTQISRSKK